MRAFSYLEKEETDNIFYKKPENISSTTDKKYLAYALGATMYMPAIREDIFQIISTQKYKNLQSLVICLEDSISEKDVERAEKNLISICKRIITSIENRKLELDNLPMIFIRVRNVKQFERFLELYKEYLLPIRGFIFPKFDSTVGEEYLNILHKFNNESMNTFYGMPILETKKVIYKESRIEELIKIRDVISRHKKYILNVRIGATDLMGLFSLRRSMDNSIYDIGVVSDCIYDIINVFSRAEDEYVISGPVWEYFSSNNQHRILKALLRETPFKEYQGQDGVEKRKNYLEKSIDGLIREVIMDKANGLIGKTIIHPTHIDIVNALYAVSKEEYIDAISIMNSEEEGVNKSNYSNKMNEIKPHHNWANKIINRAYVYGVLKEEYSYVSLL